MLEELPLLILCAPGSAVRARGPCGPGRPGLLRCRQGGLTCLASTRARARRGRSGLGTGSTCLQAKQFFGVLDAHRAGQP